MTCLSLIIGRENIQSQVFLTLTSSSLLSISIHPSTHHLSNQSANKPSLQYLSNPKLRCIW